MKTFNWRLLLLGVLLFSQCTERELVIPNSGDKTDDQLIDVVAKPSDLIFEPEYDYGFILKWPAISDKIAKVDVEYSDIDGKTYKMEFTDFTKSHTFYTKEYNEYSFRAQAFDKDGKASRVALIKAWNKDLYALQLLEEAQITQYGKYIRLKWNNVQKRALKMSVNNSLVKESYDINAISGEQFIPIKDDGTKDLIITMLDKELGLEGDKSFAFKPQGVNFRYLEKDTWTVFYDSPHNDYAWWNITEAIDGQYTLSDDLGGTPKLNAVAINGVNKFNSDRRIRTVYYTFTQKRANTDNSVSQYTGNNWNPPPPYNLTLIQRVIYVFKDLPNHCVMPNRVRLYGVRFDGTEVLISDETNVAGKLTKYDPISDPDYIKALFIDVPQNSFDGATFRGFKTEFITASLPNDLNSDNPQNIIGLAEVFVIGVRSTN